MNLKDLKFISQFTNYELAKRWIFVRLAIRIMVLSVPIKMYTSSWNVAFNKSANEAND